MAHQARVDVHEMHLVPREALQEQGGDDAGVHAAGDQEHDLPRADPPHELRPLLRVGSAACSSPCGLRRCPRRTPPGSPCRTRSGWPRDGTGRPRSARSSLTNAAGMSLSDRATTSKPAGSAVTESPWLIQEMKRLPGNPAEKRGPPSRVTRRPSELLAPQRFDRAPLVRADALQAVADAKDGEPLRRRCAGPPPVRPVRRRSTRSRTG